MSHDRSQAYMSRLKGEIDQLVAPRQLYGLSEKDFGYFQKGK
jgi:hypothetical protein